MYLWKNNVKEMYYYLKCVDCLNKYLLVFDVVNKLVIYEENEWYFYLN